MFNSCNASTVSRLVWKGAQLAQAGTSAAQAYHQLANGKDWIDSANAGLSIFGAAMSAASLAKACFAAGTPVMVEGPDGSLVSNAIEELQVGDRVLARDEFDARVELGYKAVEEVFVRSGRVMWLVMPGGVRIGTTSEHPFWVEARQEWVPAGELRVGDVLVSHDGVNAPVLGVVDAGEFATVYKVAVADWHTYFVGAAEWGWSVWAHNTPNCILKHDGTQWVLWDTSTGAPLIQPWTGNPVRHKSKTALERIIGTKDLTEPIPCLSDIGVPLSDKDIIIDNNANSAMAMVAASGGDINAAYATGKIHAGERAQAIRLQQLQAVGHEWVVVEQTLTEAMTLNKNGTVIGNIHKQSIRTVNRTDADYLALLSILAKHSVGTASGHKDRHFIADSFFAETLPGVKIVVVTQDKAILTGLLRTQGIDPAKLGAAVYQKYPAGFDVTINGRTITMLPLPTK